MTKPVARPYSRASSMMLLIDLPSLLIAIARLVTRSPVAIAVAAAA